MSLESRGDHRPDLPQVVLPVLGEQPGEGGLLEERRGHQLRPPLLDPPEVDLLLVPGLVTNILAVVLGWPLDLWIEGFL